MFPRVLSPLRSPGLSLLVALAVLPLVRAANDAAFVTIPAGNFTPVLRAKAEPERIAVAAFQLAGRPVTNAEFLAFVQANPRWQRGAVRPLFADAGYLAHWAGPLELGAGAPAEAPVVHVTWFAARAYAAWIDARLPTTAEWERAAAAGYAADAPDAAWANTQLAWFAAPIPAALPAVGRSRPNALGLFDLHTLVWEWVDDFSTAMTTGESRADTGLERDLFCGAGSAGARDPRDYAAFMRAGFRSSLRANYTVGNLGFRCARDLPVSP